MGGRLGEEVSSEESVGSEPLPGCNLEPVGGGEWSCSPVPNSPEHNQQETLFNVIRQRGRVMLPLKKVIGEAIWGHSKLEDPPSPLFLFFSSALDRLIQSHPSASEVSLARYIYNLPNEMFLFSVFIE